LIRGKNNFDLEPGVRNSNTNCPTLSNKMGLIWAATGYSLVLGNWKIFSPNTLAGASSACLERSRESRSAQ